ncbi:RDD family protein [Thalassiella azotivora]
MPVGRAPSSYPGERLGLPERGPGSVARVGRRLVGVAVDWALALAVSHGFAGGDPWATLAVFGLLHAVLTATTGTSVGHRLVGVQVVGIGEGAPPPVRAVARSFLLCLALPALVWDSDQRGLHDQLARTVLVRR